MAAPPAAARARGGAAAATAMSTAGEREGSFSCIPVLVGPASASVHSCWLSQLQRSFMLAGPAANAGRLRFLHGRPLPCVLCSSGRGLVCDTSSKTCVTPPGAPLSSSPPGICRPADAGVPVDRNGCRQSVQSFCCKSLWRAILQHIPAVPFTRPHCICPSCTQAPLALAR